MGDVKSKNPYELLGNDDEEGGSKPPTKTVDKALPRSSRRNAPETGASGRGQTAGGRGSGRGAGRGALSGSDAAYNDSSAGARANRTKPTEEGGGDRAPRRGGVRGQRGGRGSTFRDNRDDRHWKGLPNDHQKQADQSWGGNTGNSEWADERAGEAIAKSEAKEEGAAANEEEAEPEPEDNSKSYDDYLAEQAQKRMNLGNPLSPRKANEGSKQDKKWSQGKAIDHNEEDDVFMAPQGGKQTRQRERKEKNVVEIDHRFVEQPRERGGYRGDRGGGRSRGEGGRGRGEGRGRGRGEGRGEFRGRGDGGRGDGGRGDGGRGRGGRGGASVNVADKSAFPSLGS